MVTVLIVDDEQRIGALIAQLIHFDELGLELLGIYDDSQKALEAILSARPDIVISDIKMPEIDGIGIVRRTQEAGSFPHFIFISGFREFEYAHSALKYGVEEYLLKPVSESELNEALKRIQTVSRKKQIAEAHTEQIRQEAERGRLYTGLNLIRLLEKADSDVDWRELNRAYRINVAEGLFLAFSIRFDHAENGKRYDVQDQIIAHNTVTMAEERLKPYVLNQFYTTENNELVLGLLNLREEALKKVTEGLHAVFSGVRQSTAGFPEYIVTMALGDAVPLEAPRDSISVCRRRMKQRIVLGNDRIIENTKYKNIVERVSQYPKEKAILKNAAESLNAEMVAFAWEEMLKKLSEDDDADPSSYYSLAADFLEYFCHCLDLLPPGDNDRLDECWTISQLSEAVTSITGGYIEERKKELKQQTTRPIRIALDYIEENYGKKITLEEIAEIIHMNSSYFSTVFKKETGENFQNYLTNVRMEKAKELLRTTNDTMMSIAEQVGFFDTRYFSQVFARIVGVKPSVYRRMYS